MELVRSLGFFYSLNDNPPQKALESDYAGDIYNLPKSFELCKAQAEEHRAKGEFFDDNAKVTVWELIILNPELKGAQDPNVLLGQITKLQGENEDLRDPAYCPICGSCGHDGCCSAERCRYPSIKAETVTEAKEHAEELFEQNKVLMSMARKYLESIYMVNMTLWHEEVSKLKLVIPHYRNLEDYVGNCDPKDLLPYLPIKV